MRIVIKIGGSLAMQKSGPNVGYLKKFIPVIKKLRKDHDLVLVIGGGPFVREWYARLRRLGLDNRELELIGIELLKANAKVLAALVGGKAIFKINESEKVTFPVLAGIKPGRSTDANAALVAEKIKADLFLKLTDVNGIYTRDPKKHPGAKKINRLSFNEALGFAVKPKPGSYGILDPLALKVIKRSKIRTILFDGRNPSRIFDVLGGKKIGTEISD